MLKKLIGFYVVLLVAALVACLYLNVDALPKQFVMPKGPAVAPTLKPDLVITNISVVPSRILFSGDGGVITFTVKNQGTMAAGNFYCEIVGRGAETEKKLIAGLGIGEEKSDTFIVGRSGQRSASPGSYDQYVNIDPDNQIVESNKNNNLSAVARFEVYQPAGNLPNLIIIPTDQTPKIPLGSNEPVTFRVKNIGDAPTPAGITIKCQIQGRPDLEIRNPIAAGGERACSFDVSDRPVGIYDIPATINSDRQFTESGERADNTSLIRFEIIPPTQPDFTIITLEAMPKIPLGSIEPVTFKVRNIGGAGVPAGQIIKSHIEGKPDVEIRGPLGVNEEKTASFVVSDAPAGLQTKRATISPDRQIGNQSNKTALIPFEIITVPKPDLLITRVPNPTIVITQGENATISFKVKNQSEVDIPEDIQFGVTVTSNSRRNFRPIKMNTSTVALAHNQERSISFGVGADMIPDVYKVEIIANPNDRIVETTKANNKLIVWVQINPREGGAEY